MVVLADSLDRWKSARWQRGDRFYRCEVREDLFGNWVVVRFWGGVNSGKRGAKETVCQSYAEAEVLFEAVAKRRARRRYVRID
jgi:WGR domain